VRRSPARGNQSLLHQPGNAVCNLKIARGTYGGSPHLQVNIVQGVWDLLCPGRLDFHTSTGPFSNGRVREYRPPDVPEVERNVPCAPLCSLDVLARTRHVPDMLPRPYVERRLVYRSGRK